MPLSNPGFHIPDRAEMKGKLKSQTTSIAVMPFKDLSVEQDQDYFAEGVAEEIINTLSQINDLKVIGKTSSFYFKNKELSLPEIGRSLKVENILEGSIRKFQDQLRVTAQLTKADSGLQIWSGKYDRKFTDIFSIQDDLAQNIGKALLDTFFPTKNLQNQTPDDSAAYEMFLRARYNFEHRFAIEPESDRLRKNRAAF